jgi:hypothetical protein
MSEVHPDARSKPLVIVGMHRSGTSLTASLLASAGLHLGDRLLGAHTGNPLGHFEDLGFLEFHVRALRGIGDDENGYSAKAVSRLPPDMIVAADKLLADRRASGRLWGWKDPRTCLFLDFWHARAPESHYLFVFRNPADVADSLFRRGDWRFVHDPMLALEIWRDYNKLVVDFVSRHSTRCLVVEIGDVFSNPQGLVSRIRTEFGLPLASPGMVFRPDLFGKDCNPRGSAITATLAPDVFDVYVDLCEMAGLRPSSSSHRPAAGLPDAGKLLIREWARASRAEAAARDHHGRSEAVAAELARVEAERASASENLRRLEDERATWTEVTQRHAEALTAAMMATERSAGELIAARERSQCVESECNSLRTDNARLIDELVASSHRHQRLAAEMNAAVARERQLAETLAAVTTEREQLEGELVVARRGAPSWWKSVLGRCRDYWTTMVCHDRKLPPAPQLVSTPRCRQAA